MLYLLSPFLVGCALPCGDPVERAAFRFHSHVGVAREHSARDVTGDAITSSPAPDSAISVTKVWRLSCHRPFTPASLRTLTQAFLNDVMGRVGSFGRGVPNANTNHSGLHPHEYGPLRAYIHNRDLSYHFELEPAKRIYMALRVNVYGSPKREKPRQMEPQNRSGSTVHIHTETIDTGERSELFVVRFTRRDKYHFQDETGNSKDHEVYHGITELSETPLEPNLFIPPSDFKRVPQLPDGVRYAREYRIRLRWEMFKDSLALPSRITKFTATTSAKE